MTSDLLSYIVSGILIVIEYMSFYNLNRAFFKKKEKSFKVFATSVIIWLILGNTILDDYTIRMIASFVMILCVSKLSFNSDWKKSSIISIVQVVLIFAFDYLVFFVFMLIINSSYTELINNYTTFIVSGLTSKLSLYIVTYLFKRIMQHRISNISLSVIQWVEIILFSVCSMFSLYLIMDYSLETDITSVSLIISTVFIIACNIAIFFIINKIEDDNELKKGQVVLKEQIKNQTEKYEALAENYQNQRKLTHDFNSHIEAISGMVEDEDFSGALKYIKGVSKNIKTEGLILNSNHPIVDVLVNSKFYIAKEKGIDMIISSSDISDITFKNEEIVVILSNLLDNAIEAAERFNGDKKIKVKIAKENMQYIISVHNTTKEEDGFDENNIVSSKKDSMNHGYGIKNVLSILKKYDCLYLISHEDYWFKFTLML